MEIRKRLGTFFIIYLFKIASYKVAYLCCFVGIPQPSGSFASSFHGSQPPASSALQRSAVATDKPDSDDNAAYATAEEYCSNYSHEMPRKTFSHYDSSDILSRGIESVKITSVPQWPKDWMTEESGSDESNPSYIADLSFVCFENVCASYFIYGVFFFSSQSKNSR